MLVSELLEQLDLLVPNALNDRLKMMFATNVQREIYRDFPATDALYSFTTTTAKLYALPTDCPEDRIDSVTVGEVPYDYVRPDQISVAEDSWTVITKRMVLYPLPADPTLVTVVYRPRPADITDEEQQVTFSEDYASLVLYGTGKMVAMTLPEPDQVKANFCAAEFNRISEKARGLKQKSLQKKVINSRSWR